MTSVNVLGGAHVVGVGADGLASVLYGMWAVSGKVGSDGAAEGCRQGNMGYTADLLMFRPDALQKVAPVSGFYRGGGTISSTGRPGGDHNILDGAGDAGTFELRLLPCTDGTCQAMLQMRRAGVFVEAPLSGDRDNGFNGTWTYPSGCIDDITREMVMEGGYSVTEHLHLTVYDTGEPVVMLTIDHQAVPTPDAAAFDPVNCYELSTNFLVTGRLVDDPRESLEPG